MFKEIYRRCEDRTQHESHRWKWQGFFNKVWCVGRTEEWSDPWLKANPSIGLLSPNRLRELANLSVVPHKHHYHVKNKVLITPKGVPVDRRHVYWQCMDRTCWHIFSMPREVVRQELLRKPIEQSWPG